MFGTLFSHMFSVLFLLLSYNRERENKVVDIYLQQKEREKDSWYLFVNIKKILLYFILYV